MPMRASDDSQLETNGASELDPKVTNTSHPSPTADAKPRRPLRIVALASAAMAMVSTAAGGGGGGGGRGGHVVGICGAVTEAARSGGFRWRGAADGSRRVSSSRRSAASDTIVRSRRMLHRLGIRPRGARPSGGPASFLK